MSLYLGYSALNTARSALSSAVELAGSNHTVESHPLTIRLIKGVYLEPMTIHIFLPGRITLPLFRYFVLFSTVTVTFDQEGYDESAFNAR